MPPPLRPQCGMATGRIETAAGRGFLGKISVRRRSGVGARPGHATEPGHYKVRLRSISHHNLTAVYDRDIHHPRCPLGSPVLGTVPG